jgi:hypothetical protein
LEAGVAQLVEQLIRNQQVIGSSPIAGSKSLNKVFRIIFRCVARFVVPRDYIAARSCCYATATSTDRQLVTA